MNPQNHMRFLNLILIIFLFLFFLLSYPEETRPPEIRQPFHVSNPTQELPHTQSFIDDPDAPTLTFITEHSFQSGTHRPEIVAYNEKLYLVVVQPSADAQDAGYIFDSSDPTTIDFSSPETTFVAMPRSDEGMGGDHRIAIVNNELWMVYQLLDITPEEAKAAAQKGGPMEQYVHRQSLILSRFSLDGEKISTNTILTSTDFDEETFPDMSIAAKETTLLVSTGATGKMHIREIGSDGSILQTYTYETSSETIPSPIGNSLLFGYDNILYVFGYFFVEAKTLTLTTLDSALALQSIVQLPVKEDREQTFPTGVLYHEGYYYVGYMTRATGGSALPEDNPYHPALKILDSDFNVVYDAVVSTDNAHGHGHPNLAIVDDRLFYAWSKDVSGSPQIMIEEYQIS